ncbi:hypothetical protein D915_002098 [Fasciola hepatica]|uniref:Uncharacterized protein n=1 Tax=Fasciola hepatica TaxID=6192 RepID=A0A4E0S239_FASHE|nr:hypothetical protein D915_002098 [Fasciola hepatica]
MASSFYSADDRMERDLFERIRRLELRMNRLDRQPRPASPADKANPAERKPKPQGSDLELEPWPNSFQGLRQVIVSLSSRFEEQVNQLEFRIARVERELNIGTGTNSLVGDTSLLQLGSDVRSVKNQLTNLDQDFSALSGRLEERYQRLSADIESNISQIRTEMEKKISGLASRGWQHAERTSTPKRKTEGTQSEMKEFEDRIRNISTHMILHLLSTHLFVESQVNALKGWVILSFCFTRFNSDSSVSTGHSKLDKRLQALTVELRQLETEVHEQRAKLEMNQLGFRKLCSEVAQDVTAQLEKSETRIPRPALSVPRGSRAYSAERQNGVHQGLLERMEEFRYKFKAEMSLLRVQNQSELQRITQSLSDMESKLNSWNRGNNEQTSELESVLAAEIKSRRSNEIQLTKRIRITEDRVESLSKSVKDTMFQADRIPTPVTVMLNTKDNFNQLRETLQKMIEFRVSELKDQFMLLHNEVIQLQVQPVKDALTTSDKNIQKSSQSMELRKLAESLYGIKLALLMRIRLLEKQVKKPGTRSHSNGITKAVPISFILRLSNLVSIRDPEQDGQWKKMAINAALSCYSAVFEITILLLFCHYST